MADILAAIANIGILKVAGAIVIVGFFIAAFTVGKGAKDGTDSNSSSGNNNSTNGGSK